MAQPQQNKPQGSAQQKPGQSAGQQRPGQPQGGQSQKDKGKGGHGGSCGC